MASIDREKVVADWAKKGFSCDLWIDRRRLFLNLGGTLLFFVLCLFLPAGTWTWTRGWLFILVIVVASIPATLYLRRVNPEVIAARINRHKGTKRWDRILPAIFLLTVMAIPTEVAPDATLGEHNSAPNHDAGFDALATLVTYRDGQRDLSLLTKGADISVEEQLDFSTHSRTALRAGRVIELEVPQPITLGTAVVRDDLDLAIDHVLLGS